jgi:RHS repeat-associated protein
VGQVAESEGRASQVLETAATTSKSWAYDSADRVQAGATIGTAAGGSYQYDLLSRQTTLPAVDTPTGVGDIGIGYYDTDAAHTLTRAGLTTSYGLDPAGRRATETTTGTRPDGTPVNEQTERHYTDSSDNPGWAYKTGGGEPVTTWYGGSIGGDLGVQVTTTGTGEAATSDVQVNLVDTLGSVATTVTLPTGTAPVQLGAVGTYDEYGNTITTGATTGVISYNWLGGKERATDPTTGLVLMGARLYNSVTGLFTSVDPVPGGNTTTYTYPQDPSTTKTSTGNSRSRSFGRSTNGTSS